ncbi:MAG: ScyD/ScyE family protein, partial [Janthinobacterium lividum]
NNSTGDAYVLEYQNANAVYDPTIAPADLPPSLLIQVQPDGTRTTISGPELHLGNYVLVNQQTGDVYVSIDNQGPATATSPGTGEVLDYKQDPVTGAWSNTVIASGLNSPRGMAIGPDGNLYVLEQGTGTPSGAPGADTAPVIPFIPGLVSERGGDTGSITRVDITDPTGGQQTVLTGLSSFREFNPTTGQDRVISIGMNGLTITPDGTVYIAAGGGLAPETATAVGPLANELQGVLKVDGLFSSDPSQATVTPEFNSLQYAQTNGPDGATTLYNTESNLNDIVYNPATNQLDAVDAARNDLYGLTNDGSTVDSVTVLQKQPPVLTPPQYAAVTQYGGDPTQQYAAEIASSTYKDPTLSVPAVPGNVPAAGLAAAAAAAGLTTDTSGSSTASTGTDTSSTTPAPHGEDTTGSGVTGSTGTDSSSSTANTLVVQIAEDAYQGDAQFTISVDGVQEGGINTATTLESSGNSQAVTVNGPFAAGDHTVAVDFLNDAYDGTPDTDRNLYVNGATLDGTAIPGSSFTEYSAGAGLFTFTVPNTSSTTDTTASTTSSSTETTASSSSSGLSSTDLPTLPIGASFAPALPGATDPVSPPVLATNTYANTYAPFFGNYAPAPSDPLPLTAQDGSTYTATKLLVFGDRLADNGNTAALENSLGQVPGTAAAPYSTTGNFSDGPQWTTDLAQYLGATAPGQQENFAYESATARDLGIPNPFDPDASQTPLDTFAGQIQQFQKQDGTVSSNAVVSVTFGGNDISLPSTEAPQQGVADSVNAIISGMQQLVADGAKHFLVSNLPDITLAPLFSSPAFLAATGATAQQFQGLVDLFNTDLTSSLTQFSTSNPGVDVKELDLHTLFQGIAANPIDYGFTNISQPVLSSTPNVGTAPTYNPAIVGQDPQVQHGSLFLDQYFDPTALGQTLIAQTARTTLTT